MNIKPGDVIGEYIMRRDWDGCMDEIRRRLEHAQTDEKRAFYHLFLATLNKMLVKGGQRRKDREEIAKYREQADASYRRSVELDPHNINARISYADFLLRHQREPERALEILGEFGEQDYTTQLSRTLQEHRRLALRALAMAMQGKVEEAEAAFHTAFGDERFQRELDACYNSVFWTLMAHKVQLPAEMLERVLEHLKKFNNYKPANVQKFREAIGS